LQTIGNYSVYYSASESWNTRSILTTVVQVHIYFCKQVVRANLLITCGTNTEMSPTPNPNSEILEPESAQGMK